MFFGDCPAATLGRRLTAIDAAHRAAGVALPERTGQVRDVLRGRPARPVRQELDSAQVEAALRRLPSHGWINGWFGRRDRALLVLAGAGVPYRRIAALTAGDITVTDAVATINTTIRSVTLHPDDDPVLRGPCALVRWLRALHLAPTSPATRHPHPGRGDRPRRRGGRGVAASVPKPPPHRSGDRGCSAAAADRPPRLSGDRPPAAVPALGVPSGARQHHRSGRGPPRRPANRRRTAATAAARDAGRSTANALHGRRLGTGRRTAPRRPGASPRCRPCPGRDGSEGRRPQPQNPCAARRP